MISKKQLEIIEQIEDDVYATVTWINLGVNSFNGNSYTGRLKETLKLLPKGISPITVDDILTQYINRERCYVGSINNDELRIKLMVIFYNKVLYKTYIKLSSYNPVLHANNITINYRGFMFNIGLLVNGINMYIEVIQNNKVIDKRYRDDSVLTVKEFKKLINRYINK